MFNKLLRDNRMEHGLTQQKFADALGIALRTYQCYETGSRMPSYPIIMKIADILDVSVDYLLGRTTCPKINK